jgi:4-hydroxy-tetrahydrodipicolinate synthase
MGSFQGPRDWGRLLTAMITPFGPDGEVDLAEVERIADYLVTEQANDGLVVSGTTGESPTLSERDKLEILRTVLGAVGDRAAVVFGAGTYNTSESVHLAREAERLGAHGIMLVNPYYSRPGQAGLFAHFREIAGAVGLPVMLYNIQPRSSINLETETLLRLAEIENVVAVKEASGNMAQIADVCARVPDGFRVYSGDDGITLPILSVGGYGLVSVAAHVIGSELARMMTWFRDGRVGEASRLAGRLLPTIQAIFSAPSPVPVKYAMSLRGFDCERVRLPLVPLDEGEKARIQPFVGRAIAV